MRPFLETQLDYIYFVYGLAFILMAQACFSVGKGQRARLPFAWLGLFGAVHGAHEWLELVAASVGDSPGFKAVRICLMAASFMFLAEFGRAGTVRLTGKGPGRWIFLLLLALAAPGAFFGWEGVNETVRYFLGFTGGAWAAYALFLASRKKDAPGPGWLAAASAAFGLYAAFVIVVPESSSFLASPINNLAFGEIFGLPVQLIRGLLALSAAFTLNGYSCVQCRTGAVKDEYGVNPPYAFTPLLTVLAIVAAGWFVTQYAGVERLFCIGMTLTVSLLGIALFTAWQRTRESEAKGAALKVAAVRLENEGRLREITSALGEAVLVLDEKGILTFMNPEGERLLGWSEAELKGKDAHDAVHLYKADGTMTVREECPSLTTLSTGKTFRSETEVYTRKDGTNFPVSSVSAPIFDGGKVAGAVLAFQDITDRKNLERQREDFFAMVTHDLKSPLTAVMGYSDIIMSDFAGNMPGEARDMVSNIKRSAQNIFRIVEDFLAVSRLETGSMNLKESIVDIPELLDEAYAEFVSLSRKKGLTLEKEIKGGVPMVLLDRLLVYRAVANLLQNAVNYTPKGGVIRLCAESINENGVEYAVISVHDTGIGIPASEKDKVFEKYYRSARTAGVKGSGLGLTVVKTVAAAHGGRADFDSTEGAGSIFRLFLPVDRG